ncbi:transporter associated domain-containing protein [Treponema pedis]|nr:transporter associated domain-containing protein [Treponema pedis]QOW60475.1 transporter [Treponema pedis]QSI05817.1 transporter [Treponema pedis]
MKKLKIFLHHQNLRRRAAGIAGGIEIALSFAMLVGILLLSIQIFFDLKDMVIAAVEKKTMPQFSDFLSMIFSLVIGLEFVKMLIKQTLSSAIEVVLFTLARKIIADHGSMIDALLGVAAIAVLFAIKKFLIQNTEYTGEEECDYIVNGGTSIREVNHRLDSDFDEAYGNTVAGYLFNYLKREGKTPHFGLETEIGEYKFIIHEMDNDLIRYIKIVPIQH